jgi:hypothetical protein
MKKLIIISVSILLTAFIYTACTKDCKNCRAVTKDGSGTVIDNGTASEYCDTALDEKESAEPSTVGNNTTTWVCE